MTEYDQMFRKLVSIYAGKNIRYPNLRAVTLAQWLLESGRGSSALSRLHYNFAGLKWRPEMRGLATEISYEARDGVDSYCKFATLEDFVDGYWAFLNRAPYSGWAAHAGSAEDFIRFIGPIYTPSAGYADHVLALVPEAERLLVTARQSLGTIVLDPGHGGTETLGGSSPNNAVSVSGVKEKQLALDFCIMLRDLLQAEAAARGKSVRVVLTREDDRNVGIASRARVVKANHGKLFLVLHFNGSAAAGVRGTETFFKADNNLNKAGDMAFAQLVQSVLVRELKAIDPQARDRGVKPDTETNPGALGVLGDIAMGNDMLNPRCRAVYVELEFISNPDVERQLISGPDAMANRRRVLGALSKAMLDHIVTF